MTVLYCMVFNTIHNMYKHGSSLLSVHIQGLTEQKILLYVLDYSRKPTISDLQKMYLY